jgi:hypothetical protein
MPAIASLEDLKAAQKDLLEAKDLDELKAVFKKCGAPPNKRITVYGTSMWCDIPARVDD